MVAVASTMLALASPAPAFRLPDPEGKEWGLDDFAAAPGLLVAFLCNHCPYVRHIRGRLATLAAGWQDQGLAVVGINSNDAAAYPDDSPQAMVEEIRTAGYTFPYLIDESQEVAHAHRAACTPDFFLFDAGRRLAYRGQFDASRPRNSVPVTGADLAAAVDAVLAGRPVAGDQQASIGCNIKWKPGNQPDWS
ncbi:MAG: thioredoxin family protein [Acidimicrobiales bacterium]